MGITLGIKNGVIRRGPLGQQYRVVFLNGGQAAHAAAGDHADPLGQLLADDQAAVLHGQVRSGHGVLNKEIKVLDLLRLEPAFRREILDLGGDAGRMSRGVKAGDRADAAAPSEQPFPRFARAGA